MSKGEIYLSFSEAFKAVDDVLEEYKNEAQDQYTVGAKMAIAEIKLKLAGIYSINSGWEQ